MKTPPPPPDRPTHPDYDDLNRTLSHTINSVEVPSNLLPNILNTYANHIPPNPNPWTHSLLKVAAILTLLISISLFIDPQQLEAEPPAIAFAERYLQHPPPNPPHTHPHHTTHCNTCPPHTHTPYPTHCNTCPPTPSHYTNCKKCLQQITQWIEQQGIGTLSTQIIHAGTLKARTHTLTHIQGQPLAILHLTDSEQHNFWLFIIPNPTTTHSQILEIQFPNNNISGTTWTENNTLHILATKGKLHKIKHIIEKMKANNEL